MAFKYSHLVEIKEGQYWINLMPPYRTVRVTGVTEIANRTMIHFVAKSDEDKNSLLEYTASRLAFTEKYCPKVIKLLPK